LFFTYKTFGLKLCSFWRDYLDGKGKIQDVIQLYNDLGYQAVCDFPANAHWMELYNNIDRCKIILTVRDNEVVWAKSFRNFMTKYGSTEPVLQYLIATCGFAGKTSANLFHFGM